MKKKILYVINSFEFFYSHRLKVAQQAYEKGFDVSIICQKSKNNINKNIPRDFNIYNLNLRKNNFNILYQLIIFLKLIFLFIKIKPDIVHLITLKPILFGGIILKIFNYKNIVISFSGLGFFFTSNKTYVKIFSKFFLIIFKFIFSIKNLIIIFQNIDDKNLIFKNIKNNKISYIILPGSGVDLDDYKYVPTIKKNYINFLMVARLIKEKGVLDFINVSKSILLKNNFVNFTLIGDHDYANPSTIDKKIIDEWLKYKDTRYLKYQNDIRDFIIKSDVVILPSHREGFPKFLIDASAIGRAILTTNSPGCKECVIDNYNGYLFEVGDIKKMHFLINKIIKNRHKIKQMGFNSRQIAEKKYSINIIVNEHIKIYNSFL